MAYELRNNSGTLFRNKRKEAENHPDSTGTVMVNGVEYYINGWTKTTKDGDKFVSLSFKPKDAKPATVPAKKAIAAPAKWGDEDEQEIPF